MSLVAISMFQAIDNYYSHRRQDRQGVIIAELNRTVADQGERLKSDDAFFDSVRQLIILGPNPTAEQRQAIIDQLKAQDAERSARRAAQEQADAQANRGKVSGGSIPPTTRPSSSTSPTSTSPATTQPSQPSSPPPSSPPPSGPPPAAQVCITGTCVTTPPLPFLP